MKRLLISIAALVLLIAPQYAFGDDVADLKAAQGQLMKALTSYDAATITSLIHPGAALYSRDSAFPMVFPADSKEIQAIMATAMKSMSENIEVWNVNLVNMEYRVIGNIGMAWGYQSVVQKPKDGPQKTTQARATQTWIKAGGRWQLLMTHASAIPSGD